MTKDEVLKLALEALHDPWSVGPDGVANAITALRAALSEPEQKADPSAWHGWVLREVLFDNGEPIGHREPEQKPVAWTEQCFYDDGTPNPCALLKWAGRNAENDFPIGTKFYTIPPQRTWVGLTDEEIMSLVPITGHRPATTFARAIEQALKEKNT